MQTNSPELNFQEPGGGEPVSLIPRTLDKLALTWSVGIGIGYAFLVSFICWIGYRCFLVYRASLAGNYPFIITELETDLLITVAYFGIAIILRKKRFL